MAKVVKIEAKTSQKIKDKIKVKASEAGMTVAELIINSCLSENIMVLKEGAQIAKELHLIRVHLQKQRENDSLQPILQSVQNITDLLNELVEKFKEPYLATDWEAEA